MEYLPAKHLLHRSRDTRWFGTDHTMNIYRGCCHGCLYCDSRSACYQNPDFDTVKAKMCIRDRGVRFKICHCAASAAVLNYPCTHMDMVRPGIALYGYYPAPGLEGLDGSGLLPVMALKTRLESRRGYPSP